MTTRLLPDGLAAFDRQLRAAQTRQFFEGGRFVLSPAPDAVPGDPVNERDYLAGAASVWRRLHADATRALQLPKADTAVIELAEARSALRLLADRLDLDVDWPEDMHLGDMVEDFGKHFGDDDDEP